jgi:putative flippase GtrA
MALPATREPAAVPPARGSRVEPPALIDFAAERRRRRAFRARYRRGTRFAGFAAVGATGFAVNLGAVWALTGAGSVHYLASAVVATQLSTAWNYAFTDRLVFADRVGTGSRTSRFARFYAMNNAALLARWPLMVAMTSMLGLHYLASTLLSLAALTVARYAGSYWLIWNRQPEHARATRGFEEFAIEEEEGTVVPLRHSRDHLGRLSDRAA